MDEVLELDELWSLVRCKAQVRWFWVARCRRTRQVGAYVLGDRSEETCRRLWERIPEDYQLALCYSDFWRSCPNVLPEAQHEPVGKERRFVRKTLSFSKSDRMLEICLRLFVHHYNLSRARDQTYQP